MNVEQTTQLIQMILNSILMTITCALLLLRAETRQAIAAEQLQAAFCQYTDLLDLEALGVATGTASENRLLQTKKSLRQFQHRYKLIHYSWLALHFALLLSIINTFALALRTLLQFEWLIPLALAAFVIGVVALVVGVGLALFDLHTSDLSLWQEIQKMLHRRRSDGRIGQHLRETGTPAQTSVHTTGANLHMPSQARIGSLGQ
jgi:hypothetical protein